jgi:hypothetical protein
MSTRAHRNPFIFPSTARRRPPLHTFPQQSSSRGPLVGTLSTTNLTTLPFKALLSREPSPGSPARCATYRRWSLRARRRHYIMRCSDACKRTHHSIDRRHCGGHSSVRSVITDCTAHARCDKAPAVMAEQMVPGRSGPPVLRGPTASARAPFAAPIAESRVTAAPIVHRIFRAGCAVGEDTGDEESDLRVTDR